MIKFKINECPLCGKVLVFSKVGECSLFSCSTKYSLISGVYGEVYQNHYCVQFSTESVQQMIVLPYRILNYQSNSRSSIYKLQRSNFNLFDEWKFIMETPYIHSDTSNMLLNRINKIITFS